MKTKYVKPSVRDVRKLLDFLYESVLSEGGDGDAFWYSKLFDIEDLKEIIQEYDDDHAIGWQIEYDENRKTLSWGIGQEGIVVTNSEEQFLKKPDWVIRTLIY